MSVRAQWRSALKRYAMLDSLQSSGFRWLWVGRLASSATMEMGMVVQGWLAYELTGSALALGGVTAARSVARLVLSLYAGAIADRYEKRTLLLVTRGGMTMAVFGLAALIMSGTIQVWHLVVYSFLSGILSSFMMPAEKAVITELVGRESVMNAVSLTAVGMGLMGIFGASAAGFIIESIGAGSVYIIMGCLYLWALYTLTRLPLTGPAKGQGGSVWEDLGAGVRYMRECEPMMPLIFIAAVRVVLGWSYRTLMPVYAKDVLGFGARGLGLLSAAPAIGMLAASLLMAAKGRSQHKGRILLASGLTMGLGLLAFALLRSFGLVLVALVIVGAARNVTMITNQSLIQVNCDDLFRGRAMAMYMAMIGLIPVGTLPAGAVADVWGVPVALGAQGALMAAIFCWLWTKRTVRDLA